MPDHPANAHNADVAALQRRIDRERKARLEAEVIAERALRDVYHNQQAFLSETAERSDRRGSIWPTSRRSNCVSCT